jgi:hypothetical protein
MPRYLVHWETTVFISTHVDAESPERACEIAEDDPPGDVLLTDHRYPDMDDWRIREADPVTLIGDDVEDDD